MKHTVYDVADVTPLSKSRNLSKKLGFDIYLKREDLQSVHSFKLRGAYNKIFHLTPEEKSRGIIAASAGNHAQGVALSAKKLGLSAVIVMPKTAPSIKVEAVKSFGAEVELYGDNYSEAYSYCLSRIDETGRTFVHPFDDEKVIDGQGTVGLEIIDQLPEVDYIFVPIGGGGLIAGLAKAVKTKNNNVKIIGVQPEDSASMKKSLEKGKIVSLNHVGIFADGVAVKQPGELTFKMCQKYVDEVITVTNDEICAGIKDIFESTRSIVEGAGALGMAGINKYSKKHDLSSKSVVAVCSGANLSFEKLQFIAERTMLGSGQEILLAVELPEKSGALQDFCQKVVNGHNISEFNYRYSDDAKALILVGINTHSSQDKKRLFESMRKNSFVFNDLSDDEVTKEHIRHMVGGRANNLENEWIFMVDFPERSGALNDFLVAVKGVNISLFHYRGQGGDVGRVLVGLVGELTSLKKMLNKTGYDYKLASKSVKLFV